MNNLNKFVCSALLLLFSLSVLSGCKDGQQRDSGSQRGGGGGGGHSHYNDVDDGESN